MIIRDQFRYAFSNLRKTVLRTILTAAGVATGIGAMTSMVSVGLGTQRVVMQAFNEGYVLTSVMVSQGDAVDSVSIDSLPQLDAPTLEVFKTLPGVRDAYPRILIAGVMRAGEQQMFQSLEGMPARILEEQIRVGTVELVAGRTFSPAEREAIVLSERAALRLVPDSTDLNRLVDTKITFMAARAPRPDRDADTLGTAGSGQTRTPFGNLPPGLRSIPFVSMFGNVPLGLFQPIQLDLTVVGIVKGSGSLNDFAGLSLWVPVELVEPLFSQTYQDLEGVLTGSVGASGYSMVQVLATDLMAVRPLQDSIRAMGFTARSILDEINQVRRGFLFMNSLLGTIGGVSLFVAAMMIVNTLVMAVLERTREIGLLKSMGATDGDVMRLFLTEAGVIGILGGVGGLIIGFVVARVTNVIANIQFERVGEIAVNLVAFTPLLIVGGMTFAILVSLIAGYYPARRAAKVDPVVALRHF